MCKYCEGTRDCPSKNGGYICTRDEGHSGPHVACGINHPSLAWDDSGNPVDLAAYEAEHEKKTQTTLYGELEAQYARLYQDYETLRSELAAMTKDRNDWRDGVNHWKEKCSALTADRKPSRCVIQIAADKAIAIIAREHAYDNLCVYDPRSTYYNPPYTFDPPQTPREGCCCDKCTYGKDTLALLILQLLGEEP